MNSITHRQRVLGALWGGLVGDALGVPVEFRSRQEVQANPVTGMRAFGTHGQPAGTWSDDSSLSLCATESLVEKGGFDARDLGERFVGWMNRGHWTPHGTVFDIGIATSKAIWNICSGTPPESAGGVDEYDNGNGSLMRILPFALWHHTAPEDVFAETIHRASALTHRHPRSQMACVLYGPVIRELLKGASPAVAFDTALDGFAQLYLKPPYFAERLHFQLLESRRLAAVSEEEIGSSGYVMHTLTASLWCLLTSTSLEETVLKAVNLGDDTDTTGTVAGGLAGVLYGLNAISADWLQTLARRNEIEPLFERFADAIPQAVQNVPHSMNTVTLYRPVGPKELELIAASGYREFPPRLPEQPIFYPVLNEEYATQIARDWNVKASGAGYVTRVQVARSFLERYPEQVVGSSIHKELWIPAEELPEMNRNIVGLIEIIAEFH